MKLKQKIAMTLTLCLFGQTALASAPGFQETESYQVAQENSREQIKSAFDRLTYNMTVEWDQEDIAFKEHAQNQFRVDLERLMKDGVSAQEIQAYMEKSLLNQQARDDYRALLESLAAQGADEVETARAATAFMEDAYESGATFSSGGGFNGRALLVGLIVVGIVTYVIWSHNDDDDDNNEDNGDDDNGELEECNIYQSPSFVEGQNGSYDDCVILY